MKKYLAKKITAFVLVFACIMTTFTNAEDVGENISSGIIMDNVEETTLSPEELQKKAYLDDLNNAIIENSGPQKMILPTLFSQPYDRPTAEDFFGVGQDQCPIFRVAVDENDEARKNKVALTFDSAYINKYTFKLLDVLDEYNIKATFFMTYEFMFKNPLHIMAIVSRGHEIGNHSNTHPDFNKITDRKVVAEVWKCHDYIRNLIGVEMCLFRFPYGSYSPRTVALVKSLGYYPIQWAFDSVDWKNIGKQFLLDRFEATDKIVPGAIILCHNGATYTPEALPEIIQIIKSKGLECVRVSDIIYKHDFYVDTGVQYHK